MTRRRIWTMFLAHAVALAASCAQPRLSLDTVADGYVHAALRLAQHDPALVEASRADWHPAARVPVADIAVEIRALQSAVDDLGSDISNAEERSRIDYLALQLRGLNFAAERLLGRASSVGDQARDEFGVTFPPLDRVAVDRARSDIDRILAGDGSLAERLAALRRRTLIPAARKADVFNLAVAACRDAVAPAVHLPADESVQVFFRSHMALDGDAQYLGNQRTAIDINDGLLDVSRAARLACHEGYAGHHVQHLMLDQLVSRGWRELAITPGFGRHLLLAEGSAEVGADLALPPAARAALYRERLFPAAGLDLADADLLNGVDERLPALLPVVTDVAGAYLESAITRDVALQRLRDEALLGNPDATLDFIESRRARALVYGEGRRFVYSIMRSKDLAALRDAMSSRAALQ